MLRFGASNSDRFIPCIVLLESQDQSSDQNWKGVCTRLCIPSFINWNMTVRVHLQSKFHVVPGTTLSIYSVNPRASATFCSPPTYTTVYEMSSVPSPHRRVLVDDIDSQITYTGPWFQDDGSRGPDPTGNFGDPYRSTLHGVNASGSLSFQFTGKFYHL